MNNIIPVILIVDDDEKLLNLLKDYLSGYQMKVITTTRPQKALTLIPSVNPDLLVLDILMPGMTGLDLCREVRKTSTIPILILSARGDSTDKIVGLELGADDYMGKPFNPRELVSRIQSILRRAQPATEPSSLIQFSDLEINSSKREALRAGKKLKLTTLEYELLLVLASNPGKKMSRDEILLQIQGTESSRYSRSLDILISRLRIKLGENAKNPHFIKSVHGYGYIFLGESQK